MFWSFVRYLYSQDVFVPLCARVDQAGVICQQEGIFRVNCMDCLDRTNVVQAAVARAVMEQQVTWADRPPAVVDNFIIHFICAHLYPTVFFLQLKKLGVMPPEQPLPLKCYRIYQIMWANNGDTISRQYAGTAALKVSSPFLHVGSRPWLLQTVAHLLSSEVCVAQDHVFCWFFFFFFREISPGRVKENWPA